MLSAHQPYGAYPPVLKDAVIRAGGLAQVAGAVPAMCDGVTQGRDGMQALALQPRRDRHVHRDRALPRHVRRRAAARRVRQDRARPADRRALLRSPARRVGARRADGLGPAQQGEGRRAAPLRRGEDRARGACWRPRPRRTTPGGRAPSTAPPTPTSW
ncbi:hypothetical protein G5V59_19880 [Nocardioides sp. W3-2-3]|nr:hypothetical protein [Nocardioides convexus]